MSLVGRFSRKTLYGGPCMLIERHTGLALDSTTQPGLRTRPVMWTPHGLPWQQWRILRTGRNSFRIASNMNGMVLTTDSSAGDGSWVWLEWDRANDDQLWTLSPTEDRSAFVIETFRSKHSLDATTSPANPAENEERDLKDPTSPILWSTNRQGWQQWMVVRLPLTWHSPRA